MPLPLGERQCFVQGWNVRSFAAHGGLLEVLSTLCLAYNIASTLTTRGVICSTLSSPSSHSPVIWPLVTQMDTARHQRCDAWQLDATVSPSKSGLGVNLA